MLNTAQNIGVVFAIVAGSLAFLWVLRRVWPNEERRAHNDLIGWQVTVLGTTYAVILGFMLYTVWSNFQIADSNVEGEANCLVNLARSAVGLSASDRRQIQDLAQQYIEVMLNEEWPAMNRSEITTHSHDVIQRLWFAVVKAEAHNISEQTSLDHAISELSEMTKHRRLRDLEVVGALPGVLWSVLVIGAVVTIVSACLFGSADMRLQLIQVIMLAALLSLILVAIADINRPFQGSVHVSPAAFERARAAVADIRALH